MRSEISPQSTFLMTYLSLIVVCVGRHAQQLKINRKYTTIKRWLDTSVHCAGHSN